MSAEKDLGKLKRSINRKCPDCKHALQIRTRELIQLVRGEENTFKVDYIYCPSCEFEESMEQKHRKPVLDKTAFVPEEIIIILDKQGYDRRNNNHARYSKRGTTNKFDGAKGFRGS